MSWVKRASDDHAELCVTHGHNWMNRSGMRYLSDPPQFDFTCNTCGAVVLASARGIENLKFLDCRSAS